MSTDTMPDTEFRHMRFRVGYAVDEVDSFVPVVEDALRAAAPRLCASAVARQTFTPVMLKPGYRMDDVDAYLDHAERRLQPREHEE